MPRYRFTGTDAAGRRVTGERDAPNPDALLTVIAGEIVLVDSVQLVNGGSAREGTSPPAGRMHDGDIGQISSHIAGLVEAQLPLESGLAAIADECPSLRMRRTLRAIVGDMSAGSNLEAALAARGAPSELTVRVRAGARSGNTGQILEHYVINVQGITDLRMSIGAAMLYPLVLVVLFGLLGALLALWIVPQFAGIFSGFDLDLPMMSKMLIVVSEFFVAYGAHVALGTLVFAAVVVLLLRYAAGKVIFRRLVCQIPLFGPILRWTALSRFSQLLSLLVENGVPLDEALVLAGDASGDSEIQEDCRRMRAGVTSGETLESAARKLDRFPASFVQALAWERRPAGLPEVLQSLGDMYAGRVRATVAVMVAILPPFLMIGLGLGVGFVVIALFMPLIEFLNKLS
jgi:type IV pilus assembly protein PilC